MKKAIAFLLSAAMGFTVLHYPGLAADPIKATEETQQTEAKREALDENIIISIVHEDLSEEPVSSFTILENEKIELTTNAMDDYYWQIRVAEDTWVKIADYQSSNLIVTRALIYNLLDETNSVQIRVALNGAEAIQLSNPITVTLNEGQTLASDSFDSSSSGDFTNNQPAAAEPVILPDMVIADGPYITEPADQIVNEPQIEDSSTQDDYENPEETESDYSVYENDYAPQNRLDETESNFWADNDGTQSSPDNDLNSNGTNFSNEDDDTNNEESNNRDQIDTNHLSPADNGNSAYEENASNFDWSSLLNLLSPQNTADTNSDNSEPTNPPEPEMVTIFVNYIFEDGETAYSPYTATVAKGSDFETTIYPPEIQGYEPSEDQRVLNIHYSNIQNDKTITVTYYPASVNFTVNYYYQNIEDDNYQSDPNNPDLKTGTTNHLVKDDIGIVRDKEGFIRLPYDETERIAADGSTQVNIYYDRLYFLVLFDMDGGFGTEPVYAKYGSPLSPNNPIKPGYQFVSWKEADTNNILSPTVPAKNITYKAQWKENEKAKVTVVYWGQNPDKYQASIEGKEPIRIVDDSYSFLTEKVYENQTVGESLSVEGLENELCFKTEHSHNETCLSCSKESHNHSFPDCYLIKNGQTTYNVSSNTPANPTNAPKDPDDGQIYIVSKQISFFNEYYIAYNNNWYKLSKDNLNMPNGSNKLEITKSCQKEEHTHGNGCYTCGKEEHTHDSKCKNTLNQLLSDSDAHLKWYYNAEKSDKDVQVQPDGSTVINVYFDRVRYNMTFKNKNQSTIYESLNDKWGTNIHEMFRWVCNIAETTNWDVELNPGDSGWISYIQVIPLANKTYIKADSGKDKAEWFIETLESDDPNNKNNYKLYTTAYASSGNTVNEQETELRIEGFTFQRELSSKNGDDFDGAKFYHKRNKYELKFSNIDSGDDNNSITKTVPFEKQLVEYSFTPNPPKGMYEEGSVEFAGWYKNKDCSPGAVYNLSNSTMPPANLILYAKWVPVTRHVTFRTSKETSLDDLLDETHVPHRSYISDGDLVEGVKNPENQNLNFIGWFYEEEVDGKLVEKAFDLRMPVTKDMNLYGKWGSKDLVTYTIFYAMKDTAGDVIKDEDDNVIYIADPEKVSGLHEKTKTIEAKTRNDLYPKYQAGFYPITSSHSITFDITKPDADKTFTFYYIQKEEVEYTVRYLEKDTNKVLHEPKISKTTDDVITESYAFVQGYMPDKFSKRLVLQAEGKNEIVFYYSKDDKHAPVVIEYWVRNLEGDRYSLKEHIEENNRTVDSQIKVQIKDYPDLNPSRIEILDGDGTTLEESILGRDSDEYSSDNTILTAKGLHIKVYYERDGRITIHKNVDKPVKSDRIFLFKLSSDDAQDQNININVPIEIKKGNTTGSITVTSLPIGTENEPIQYTVEELTDWHQADYSLSNAASTQTIGLSTKSWKGNVTFNNYETSHNWFTDSDAIRNTFKQYSSGSVSPSEAGGQ